MIRLPLPLLIVALPALVAAEEVEVNPFLGRPPAELRRQIEDASPALEESWFQVDVIVFARNTPASEEYWRLDAYPEFPREYVQIVGHPDGDESTRDDGTDPDKEAQLPENADRVDHHAAAFGAWQALDNDASHLIGAAQRLERSAAYRILYETSWHQPTRDQEQALPVYLEGGRELPLPLPEVLPTEASPDNVADDDAMAPERNLPAGAPAPDSMQTDTPATEVLTEPELRGTLRLSLSRFLHVEPNLWLSTDNDQGERYHVAITQSRRMRSEETHYIDHPLFGLLVRITPWEHPEQVLLQQKKDALEASP